MPPWRQRPPRHVLLLSIGVIISLFLADKSMLNIGLASVTDVKHDAFHTADGNETFAAYETFAASTNNTILYRLANGTAIHLPSAKSLLNKPPPFQESDIHRLSSNMTMSPNSIVTAYFRIPSKHSSKNYVDWMQNLLSLHDNMVIFTSGELFAPIKHLRSHAFDRTVLIVMNISDIPVGTLYPTELWEDQLGRDFEKDRHQSYQLFWIWLAKSWWVTQAIRFNFFESDLFLWSDIGGDREGLYKDKTLILHREVVPPSEMVQMTFQIPRPPDVEFFDDKREYMANFFHSGMHAVAYSDTWLTFYGHFLDMVDRFLEHNMLLVDDQVVLQSVCLSHPEVCAYVLCSEVPDKRYRALRYILHHGGDYHYWRYDKNNPYFDGSKFGPIRNQEKACQFEHPMKFNASAEELSQWCGFCPWKAKAAITCDQRVQWLKSTYNTEPADAMADYMRQGKCKKM